MWINGNIPIQAAGAGGNRCAGAQREFVNLLLRFSPIPEGLGQLAPNGVMWGIGCGVGHVRGVFGRHAPVWRGKTDGPTGANRMSVSRPYNVGSASGFGGGRNTVPGWEAARNAQAIRRR